MGFEQEGHDLTYVLTSYSGGCVESGLKEMSLAGTLRRSKVIGKSTGVPMPSSVLAGVIQMTFLRVKCLGSLFPLYLGCLVDYIGHREPAFNYSVLGPFLKQTVRMKSTAAGWKLPHSRSLLLSVSLIFGGEAEYRTGCPVLVHGRPSMMATFRRWSSGRTKSKES